MHQSGDAVRRTLSWRWRTASYRTMAALATRCQIAADACAEIVPELRATPSITRRHEVACIKVETLSGAR